MLWNLDKPVAIRCVFFYNKKRMISKILNNFEEIIAAALLVIMVAVVFLEVAVRPFGCALGYLTEITPDLFVWLVMLGAAAGFKRGMHLSMSALTDKLPVKPAKIIFWFGVVASITFFLIIGVSSLKVIQISMENNETNALGMPQWIFSAAIPSGCFLCVVRCLQFAFLGDGRNGRDGREEKN